MKKTIIGLGIGLGAGILYMHATDIPSMPPIQTKAYSTIHEYQYQLKKNDVPLKGYANSSYLTIEKHLRDKGYSINLCYKGENIPLYEIHGKLVAGKVMDNIEGALRHAQPAIDRAKGFIDEKFTELRDKKQN